MLQTGNVIIEPSSGGLCLDHRPEESKWKSAIDKALWHVQQLRSVLQVQASDGTITATHLISPPVRSSTTTDAQTQTEAVVPATQLTPFPLLPNGCILSARDLVEVAVEAAPSSPHAHELHSHPVALANPAASSPSSVTFTPEHTNTHSLCKAPFQPSSDLSPASTPITATAVHTADADANTQLCSHRLETPLSEAAAPTATPSRSSNADDDAHAAPVVALELAPEDLWLEAALISTPRCDIPAPASAGSTPAWAVTPDIAVGWEGCEGCESGRLLSPSAASPGPSLLQQLATPQPSSPACEQAAVETAAAQHPGTSETAQLARADTVSAITCRAAGSSNGSIPAGPTGLSAATETFTPYTTAVRLRAAMQWMRLQLQSTPGWMNRPRRHSESSVAPAMLILGDGSAAPAAAAAAAPGAAAGCDRGQQPAGSASPGGAASLPGDAPFMAAAGYVVGAATAAEKPLSPQPQQSPPQRGGMSPPAGALGEDSQQQQQPLKSRRGTTQRAGGTWAGRSPSGSNSSTSPGSQTTTTRRTAVAAPPGRQNHDTASSSSSPAASTGTFRSSFQSGQQRSSPSPTGPNTHQPPSPTFPALLECASSPDAGLGASTPSPLSARTTSTAAASAAPDASSTRGALSSRMGPPSSVRGLPALRDASQRLNAGNGSGTQRPPRAGGTKDAQSGAVKKAPQHQQPARTRSWM
ncbi:hypothetical protein Agub_g9991 [Astrephomene gubernaculifera]|uniref:Uncharacterized protein n=1 Tax=Astrephomene gubernaculifera TaxID=47775 RepID=A0AAD3HPG8_9CHLO|nr:hypothetical protein Agub_g9991 [Astrephomene gubernaculifera]